ncbi:ECF RNA polymerase sigma factor SigX [Myxococcaceae bacterium]|jgi:RNA polymerase sigma-70 factor (ECF subfamily)|nr:ECF RNA polymerase sigma factor SigX [Myxococcaceae bacterium]
MAAPDLAVGTTTDEVLVELLKQGDREAFETLYERYLPRIFQYVDRRLRNRADTEETVQEVFINVFSSIESYRGEAPFGAWVFGLTRRTIAARFKKKRHTTVPLGDDEPESVDLLMTSIRREPDPLQAYEAAECVSRLDHVYRRELSDEQRTLFQLHHLENHPIQEIARSLRKSEDAVKSNLYRARKALLAR